MEYESYQMSNLTNGQRLHSHNGRKNEFKIEERIDKMNIQINSTRAQRIRAGIFSETLDNGPFNNFSSQLISSTDGKRTAVQKLSESSQLLKDAVNDIINYKEDADITVKALPELIRLLHDKDPTISGQAALVLHTLAKKEASRLALSTPQLIQALIQAMSNSYVTNEIRQGVSGVLHCLSQKKHGLLLIFKEGAIPLLIKLLDSSIESIVNYALSTLHNLLLNYEQSKFEILRCGGCQKMVGLLNSTDQKFLAILIDCLHILAFNNEEVKIIIESSNGPQQLLHILDRTDYEKLLWTITRLLRVLSCSSSIKTILVSKNGIDILEKKLNQIISLRVQQNCLQILRNLSDQAVNLENLDSLIQLLIKFLQAKDLITISCSVGILSNLTCNNQYNKMILVQSNGVQALINTIIQVHDQGEIIEPAICALRHVTCRHSYATEAQNAVRKGNGLLPIVDLLNPTLYSWPIIKSTLNLIRNLGLSVDNLPILRETKVIEKLIKLLNHSQQEFENQQLIDNYVRIEDIVEGCVSALHIIAKDEQNRNIIRDLNSIPLFIRFLYSPTTVPIQRAVTGVLCELVNDPLCVNKIEQEKCSKILTELIQSDDEGVATYAAAVLFHLSENKTNVEDVNLTFDHNKHSKNKINQNGELYLNLHQTIPSSLGDSSTMNYYASEGSDGSGLAAGINKQNVHISNWFDSDL